jgi:putative Mn2+ efflux pump MntP
MIEKIVIYPIESLTLLILFFVGVWSIYENLTKKKKKR